MEPYNRRDPHMRVPADAIDIGRPGFWGNPYTHLTPAPRGTHPTPDRYQAVWDYVDHVCSQPHMLAALHMLVDRPLVCWCAPRLCHGHVLHRMAWAQAEGHSVLLAGQREVLAHLAAIIQVTGSRSWADGRSAGRAHEAELVRKALDDVLFNWEEHAWAFRYMLVSGMARGVDTVAAHWAAERGPFGDHNANLSRWPADWDRHGRSAGPRRNQAMVDYCLGWQAKARLCGADPLPVEVVAFKRPVSRGTADMLERCERAGFTITVHDLPALED